MVSHGGAIVSRHSFFSTTKSMPKLWTKYIRVFSESSRADISKKKKTPCSALSTFFYPLWENRALKNDHRHPCAQPKRFASGAPTSNADGKPCWERGRREGLVHILNCPANIHLACAKKAHEIFLDMMTKASSKDTRFKRFDAEAKREADKKTRGPNRNACLGRLPPEGRCRFCAPSWRRRGGCWPGSWGWWRGLLRWLSGPPAYTVDAVLSDLLYWVCETAVVL